MAFHTATNAIRKARYGIFYVYADYWLYCNDHTMEEICNIVGYKPIDGEEFDFEDDE